MILPNQAKYSSFACFSHCLLKGLSTIFNSPHRRSVHILLLYSSGFFLSFLFSASSGFFCPAIPNTKAKKKLK